MTLSHETVHTLLSVLLVVFLVANATAICKLAQVSKQLEIEQALNEDSRVELRTKTQRMDKLTTELTTANRTISFQKNLISRLTSDRSARSRTFKRIHKLASLIIKRLDKDEVVATYEQLANNVQ